MSKPARAQYVTANDLLSGEVVFLGSDGGWVKDLAGAMFFTDPDEGALHLTQAEADGGRVVGAYLTDAAINVAGDSERVPSHFRERVRVSGPSNYFHGKQERAADV